MRRAVQKGRNRPPRLTETRTTVGNQHQLQKERLVAARVSLLVDCSGALVARVRALNLVSRLPRRPQLPSKFCRGCIGPCSETFSACRVRDPFRKRLHRAQR
jgi:hypothetical protein